MKKQQGITMIYVLAFLLVVGISWIKNFYHFIDSDFASPYKAEVIHGIGVIVPPISLVTAWVDLGK